MRWQANIAVKQAVTVRAVASSGGGTCNFGCMLEIRVACSVTFGLSRERGGRFNLTTLEPDLEALHDRLSGVCVTCLDFPEFIRRLDRPDTLFYLDPPYWGCEGYYGRALFSRGRFEELADQLRTLQGRFIMSLNDTPGVREVFGGFHLEHVTTTYTASAAGTKVAPELLIMNFEPGVDGPSKAPSRA